MTTELRISVRNTSDTGGTAITPVFTAFHDNSFDIYDLGAASSAGLEALAEDGNNSVIAAELLAADADAQSVNVAGPRGPIAARELGSTTLVVDGASNGYVGLASMLLPSNDAFVGTANAQQVFDADGNFLGATTISFDGGDVRDAGTEVNTEMDAAFINQMGPNTGVTEGGVVTVHPGFNGSVGNPGGDQIILGGTNAFADFIDPAAADFTLPNAGIATVHINEVNRETGTDGGDQLRGDAADDFLDGGAGNDIIIGGDGWDVLTGGDGGDLLLGNNGDDVIDGGAGRDIIKGGRGNDDVDGGAGRDLLIGGRGADNIDGGDGRDFIFGGNGGDVIAGGAGKDNVTGGGGDDVFVFGTGDGRDVINDFDRRGDDRIDLGLEGVDDLAGVLALTTDFGFGVSINAGDGDALFLLGVSSSDLTDSDFLF